MLNASTTGEINAAFATLRQRLAGATMNVADGGPFDIADFVPARLLGEGVWGRVYDLGDGTVLKIAREQCAGIGSGRAKIENECEALTLLAAARVLAGLIPVVHGRGDIPSSSPLAQEDFAVWLRMTKVSGRIISADDIGKLSRDERSRIGRDLGMALARAHAALRRALAVARRTLQPAGAVEIYADVSDAAAQLGDPFYMDAVAQLTTARRRIASEVLSHPIHGDFGGWPHLRHSRFRGVARRLPGKRLRPRAAGAARAFGRCHRLL